MYPISIQVSKIMVTQVSMLVRHFVLMNLQNKYRNKCANIWYIYLRVYPGIEIEPRFLCCVAEHIIKDVRLLFDTNHIHSSPFGWFIETGPFLVWKR